MVFTNYH